MRLFGVASRFTALVLLILLAVGAGLSGYLIYSTARDAVVHAQFKLPDPPQLIPGRPQEEGTAPAVEQAASVPMRTPQVATSPEPHNERINILVLGLDVPDGGAEPARADTIMVVSVDPTGGPVSLLSIPRDLWVPIGPYGENRINTAYFLGEVKDYPGGGPGLLRATVEQMFGIYIDYYVVGDFDGFRKLVDQLGGVTITVETDIYDPAYPDGNGGVKTISIPAGTYRMDGEMALEYARSRHTTSDFDRAQRQQRLLLAIRDEALKRESISSLLPKLPGFYQTLSETVETDLSLDELIDLAQIASVVDINNVQTAVIDQTMTSRYITDKGWDVLLPIPEKIQPVIERLFRLPTASNAEPVAYELDASPQVVAEQAKVLLVNGSGKHGLAEAAADYLRQQGFTIIGSSDLERGDYSTTVVVTYSEKPSTVAALCSALHLTSESIRQSSGSPNPEQADIKVIIGQDFELPAD